MKPLLLIYANIITAIPLVLFETGQKVLGLFDTSPPALTVPYNVLEEWIEWERNLAFDRIIRNIGGYGDDLDDDNVAKGAVVASRSKVDPDYFYQWTRDSGIAIDALTTKYDDGGGRNETLRRIIEDYIQLVSRIQRIENPSGDFRSLDGLGEPKFLVDGTEFNRPWGRPQRDGPALRSNAIIKFINSQVQNNISAADSFISTFYKVIKPDLDYVSTRWDKPGFDIWEEYNDIHYFTNIVQLRSLVSGNRLTQLLGLDELALQYHRQADKIRQFMLSNYYDPRRGHIMESLHNDHRTGLDAAVFIGTSLAGSDLVFSVENDTMITTLDKLIEDMSRRFAINNQRIEEITDKKNIDRRRIGVGIGRYPEDIYDGVGFTLGNPWFLTTSYISQTLYTLAEQLAHRAKPLVITGDTISFYSRFLGTDMDRIIGSTDPSYTRLIREIIRFGDSFLDVIREHCATDGTMSEQFNRNNGFMQGASDLTWSYSAFWSATRQRNQTLNKTSYIYT